MNGFVLGIVAQNNDPQKRGRVKVFVPHVSMNLIGGWDDEKEKDKSFEKLSDETIRNVINKIKDQLPWANCATTIMGETGNHYYDSRNKKSLIGDSLNKKEHKPGKNIETNPPVDFKKNVYKHNSYSNSAKGVFGIPKVGSKVWVFFENNNKNRPVYFATSYNKMDWENISDGDYPDIMENVYGDDAESDEYKNKLVISQRGGVIEIINSDNRESLQISHYNGGFKIWSNDGTKEYVEGNDKKFVKSDSHIHIGGNKDVYIEGDANINVDKSCSIKSEKDMLLESGTKMTLKSPIINLNP